MRLLDVGCGWGGMVHATPPRHHGVRAVGVTLSRRAGRAGARSAVAEAGLGDRVEIRLQDYRDVRDGPFDAISSIGMFEHVGLAPAARLLRRSSTRCCGREGRLLNHAIGRPPGERRRRIDRRRAFIDRYVFPDGELHEVGTVVSRHAGDGLRGPPRREPARALRPHAAGAGSPTSRPTGTRPSPRSARRRARIWRLYMAGSARRTSRRAAPGPPGAGVYAAEAGAAACRCGRCSKLSRLT